MVSGMDLRGWADRSGAALIVAPDAPFDSINCAPGRCSTRCAPPTSPSPIWRGWPTTIAAIPRWSSHFGAPAWVLDELAAAGFDLFATATNHALDHSTSGLLETIEALEARGLW